MAHYRKFLMVSASRVVALAAVAASALMAVPADATPASGFTAAQQWKGVYPPMQVNTDNNRSTDKSNKWDFKLMSKDTSDVYVTRNAIAVNGQSGWHSHPGPSLITVTIGVVTNYDGSDPACAPTRYSAGQGFLDSGDHAHLIRNESGAPAETVATQFVPTGATRRIDEPKPTNCNF